MTTDSASRWIYRGIWRVLVNALRVPDQPPTPPPGSGDLVRAVRPAPGFLGYLRLWFWIGAVLFDAILLVVWILILGANPIAGVLTAPLFFALAIVPDILAYIGVHVRFDTTYYVVTERAVRIRRGVWLVTEHTITFENVQNVSVRQGPVQRHFGIADVVIETAGGGSAESPHAAAHQGLLEGVDDAPALRDLIMQRAGQGAGLGDDAPPTSAGLSPEHLALLREIRDALRPSAPNESAS